ncbi:MAG TPA: flagellar basal body L-ring protein FlgH [Fibrobacteria bacterium]|nr:flagellar basal body L-ring protein FlgH [Fibrobacteria bacterium]HOX51952.1 flagellar basal body L-ring protein FlgH [Fibrobacteria bacterium]
MPHTIGILRALLAMTVCVSAAAPLPRDFSLTGDRKSHRVDDVITVKVGEDNTAKNTAGTRTQSKSDASMSVAEGTGLLGFIPGMGVKSAQDADFNGQGNTVRQGSMQAVVSARVVEVLPNGTLRIEGTKQVVINDETEVLSVAGLLRPEDIASDNSVSSGRLADARISYSGRGTTANAQEQGPVARFFDWLF